MDEKTSNSSSRTLKNLFAILDGRIYRWRLYNGRIDLVESADAERSVEYEGGTYWDRWRRDNEVEEGDRLDMLFLSDSEETLKALPEWLFERMEESGWKREVLEQILEEKEFKGKGVTLLTEEGERVLGPRREAGVLRLFIQSSRTFHLEVGVAEELAACSKQSSAPDAIPAGVSAGGREIVVSKRKEELIQICDDLRVVLDEAAVEYGKDLPGRLESVKSQISDYVFKIYLVGPFSCGKSSLLNRWLGMEHLLPTGIAPETAISTELRYGTVPCMDLYPLREGGAVERLDVLSPAAADTVRLRRPALILANPPYLTGEEMKRLPDNVRREPALALFGGEDGLTFYRAFADLCRETGVPILAEIGWKQGKDVLSILGERGLSGEIYPDEEGRDRVLFIRPGQG